MNRLQVLLVSDVNLQIPKAEYRSVVSFQYPEILGQQDWTLKNPWLRGGE